MNCENNPKNLKFCTCTYSACPRKGLCCECVQYHLSNDELPGCFFPPGAEATYDRSRSHYISLFKQK